ncbi:MAG: small multidrug resistance family (SMR) protein, partial [uncultured Thermomicrobiales bacterium]
AVVPAVAVRDRCGGCCDHRAQGLGGLHASVPDRNRDSRLRRGLLPPVSRPPAPRAG